MASEKQILANRLNSQQSTGPRTEAGKSTSRMNALKSGLHAESHIIRSEDPEVLAQLTAEYYDEFHPATPRQRDLVDTIVHNQWLIRRLRLTEADLHAHHFQQRDDDFEEKWRYKVVRKQHPLADAFESLEKRLLRLQSRLNSLERSNRAALKDLRALQLAENNADCDAIGFVPSDSTEASETVPDTAAPDHSPSPDRPYLVPETTAGSPLRTNAGTRLQIGFVPSFHASGEKDGEKGTAEFSGEKFPPNPTNIQRCPVEPAP
jgi:hypothetical protein